jgi:hypothetical protein
MAVGGMPDVLNAYLITHSFNEVFNEQKRIIDSYRDDISKYCTTTMKAKVRQIFDSMPRQLSKKGTQFKYSIIDKKANSKSHSSSID